MENLRKLVPKDRADLFGVGTTLVLLSFVTVNDILVINANREGGDDLKALLVLAIGLYILFNALGNMYKAISVNTSIDSIEVQIKQLPEWRFCSNCEQYAPPRSYHCFTCNKCILKRHNHCLFLGKCVGNNNHRYYLMFLVYIWLGSVYNTALNWDYFVANFSQFTAKSLLITFMPLFAWILGMLSLTQFFFVFTNSICFILSILMFVYSGINIRMALNGQTWNENAKNITIYNLGWRYNLGQILGRRLISAVFNPFAESTLSSNGASFRKRDESSEDNDEIINVSSPFSVPKRRII